MASPSSTGGNAHVGHPDKFALMFAKVIQRKAHMYNQLAEEFSQELGLAWSAMSGGIHSGGLSSSTPGVAPKATPKKKPTKDPNAPKRPKTSFFLFCEDQRNLAKEQNLPSKSSKELSDLWKNLTEISRKKYEDKAARDRERFEETNRKYKESLTSAANASSPTTASSSTGSTTNASAGDNKVMAVSSSSNGVLEGGILSSTTVSHNHNDGLAISGPPAISSPVASMPGVGSKVSGGANGLSVTPKDDDDDESEGEDEEDEEEESEEESEEETQHLMSAKKRKAMEVKSDGPLKVPKKSGTKNSN
eukprot:Filipodium_phascolosomae@DN2274_c0_g1_i1.p1